jgi:hypothetical protein
MIIRLIFLPRFGLYLFIKIANEMLAPIGIKTKKNPIQIVNPNDKDKDVPMNRGIKSVIFTFFISNLLYYIPIFSQVFLYTRS